MTKRSYDQYCPLARSLDLLGERWTLLIVRDLIPGPRRYTDLSNELAGIPSDLLTQRLRDLESAGVITRRKLPPPAASSVYELTERGRELEPALVGLARFGLGLLSDPPDPDDPPSPERVSLLLRVLFDPDAAPRERETVLLDDGRRTLAVGFDRAGFDVEEVASDAGSADAAAVARGGVATLYELLTGGLDLRTARDEGAIEVEGDSAALARFRAAFPAPAGPGLRTVAAARSF
jgi:DNA-binding HxlR family transcriptional regulator